MSRDQAESSAGGAILLGMLAAATTAALGVEMLSTLGAIRAVPLRGLAVLAIAVFLLVVRLTHIRAPEKQSGESHPVLLAALLVTGAVTLLTALIAAPNSWDSMTYHMARIAQWYDHGGVEHYATGNDRQLWQPPFGEYLVLLTYGALAGRDFLANIPGWLAGVGTVIATMEIARLLGAGSMARYSVGLFTATTPSVVLHASSTHVDLIGGLWIAVAAWLALSEHLRPTGSMRSTLWFGAAAGLAIGTKGTSIPLLLPWIVLFLSATLRPLGIRALVGRTVLIGLVAATLIGSHYLRNLELFEHPFAPTGVQGMLRPASLSVPSLLSNLAAHATLQMGTPWQSLNSTIADGFRSAHSNLGIDLPRLYPYLGGFRVTSWNTHEDIGGNPLQFILGLAGLAVVIATWRRRTMPERLMVAGFFASIVLFTVAVRWQPFNARLHLPILVLLSPCLLLVLVRELPRVACVCLTTATLVMVPSLLVNQSRPFLSIQSGALSRVRAQSILTAPREEQYFANRPELYAPYRAAMAALERLNCRRAALKASYDSWEYPLWALGRQRGLRLEQYDPNTPPNGGPKGRQSERQCGIVVLDHPAEWTPESASRGGPVMAEAPVVVWALDRRPVER